MHRLELLAIFILMVLIPASLILEAPSAAGWEGPGKCTVAVANVTKLSVQVWDENNEPVNGAYIRKFDANWNYRDSQQTRRGGWANWSQIPPGNYWLEVHYLREWWGTWEVVVERDRHNDCILPRIEPYASRVDHPSSITWPHALSVTILVRNPNVNFDRNVRVTLVIDRDVSPNYDYNVTSPEQTIPKNGGTRIYNFPPFEPPALGNYFVYYHVETWHPRLGKVETTDLYKWESSFSVSVDYSLILQIVIVVIAIITLISNIDKLKTIVARKKNRKGNNGDKHTP